MFRQGVAATPTCRGASNRSCSFQEVIPMAKKRATKKAGKKAGKKTKKKAAKKK